MNIITYLKHNLTPSKVVCIGRNYVEHIHELGNEMPESMVFFIKPNSAITDTLYDIDDTCRFESEITFLIQDNRLKAVGIGLDLTHAKLQNYLKDKGLPWERAKAFDCSCVLSPFVPLIYEIDTLSMKLYINETLIQHASYELMIHKPHEMVEEILTFLSLEDGDILMSGTPKGVGYYNKSDRFDGYLYSNEEEILHVSWSVA